MVAGVACHAFYNAVDAFWVSKLAPHAVVAVSISQITLSIMVSLEGEQVPEAPTEEIAVSGD